MKSEKCQFIRECLDARNSLRSRSGQLFIFASRQGGMRSRADLAHHTSDFSSRGISASLSDCNPAIKQISPVGVNALSQHLENNRSGLHDVTSHPEHRVVPVCRSATAPRALSLAMLGARIGH